MNSNQTTTDLDWWKVLEEKNKQTVPQIFPSGHRFYDYGSGCPNCGYCQHCGRGGRLNGPWTMGTWC